jgi:hypothetical protein
VRAEVLAARVNTWTGPREKGHAPNQYLAPAELSPVEGEWLTRAADEFARAAHRGTRAS